MISCALRSPKASARCSSVAVPRSSVPCSAERRTSDVSSSAERAEASSSCGSTPIRRRIAFAVPLKKVTIGPGGDREATLEGLDHLRGRERGRDRQVLGHQLAEDHRHAGGEDERDRERDRRHGALGHPGGLERPGHEVGDRRLGQEADQQVGDRDPDLRGRELGREVAQRLLDAAGAAVAALGGAVDRRAVDRDEGELGRDERPARHDQREGDQDQKEFDQRAPSDSRARQVLQLGSSVIDPVQDRGRG